MRHALAIAALALIPTAGFADDAKPVGHNGLTIGHDGKMWRMEGCAAYPVEAQAGGQSKPVAISTPAEDTGDAASTDVAAAEPAAE